MTWRPPFDECRQCIFFRKNKAQPICKFCGCGEFFEARDPDSAPPSEEKLMRICERMMRDAEGDRTIPLEEEAISAADESDDE